MRKYLLWVDLETTGVDPLRDPIIEVAAVLTERTNDDVFKELWASSYVVWHPKAKERLEKGEPHVLEMHTKNNLLSELDYGTTIQQAERWIIDNCETAGVRPNQAMLAGSGVAHFDNRFIREQMPTLSRFLAYPVLDVGVVRRVWEITGLRVPKINSEKTHRAMDDIRLHMEEARYYVHELGLINERTMEAE